jgi:hypothetical protein
MDKSKTETPSVKLAQLLKTDPAAAIKYAHGYCEAEKLARIREGGKLRGVTLVPLEVVAAFVRSQMGGRA